MKITFDHLQENTNQIKKSTDLSGQQSVKSAKGTGQTAGVSGILFGKGQDQQAYGKQGKTMQDIKEQAGLLSGDDYKNYMTVMAQTMSGEDFSALMQDGVKPGKTDTADMVTIMDHIKTVMAQSGVVISGFNGSGDIPMEKLEAMAGSSAYAQTIANTFAENDVPLTEENVQEAMKQTELATEIEGLSDNVKQYLIENGADLSIDQIYKAKYSAGTNNHSQTGSYFADDLNGYYGKTTENTDYTMLSSQIEKIIKEAKIPTNEETKAEAAWLLEKGMLLTSENLNKLHQMNEMEFPITKEDALSHIAQALREGKAAKDADLSKDGIYKQAEALKEMVEHISEDAVKQVVSSNETLNIRNLSSAQKFIDMAAANIAEANTAAANTTTANIAAAADNMAMDAALVHAQRTLQEVRLQMTVSANIMLLKSNYAIDTAELSELVEQLKETEQKMTQTQGLSLPDAQKNALFTETMQKTAAIRQMPAAVTARVIDISESYTLSNVYEQGRILQSTYQKAGESYEALMTAPRADLGDRLKDAFSNIDDILQDLDFELTEENRKAVRILAYNQSELTRENITAVKNANQQLSFLLTQMTPSATLQMIREGVNPLEESVNDLTDYFMQKENDLMQQAETFSRFLYNLEQNKEISPEERDSYMGIYRLIRQIEKGDGKAIGTVVANGQELTFANLLSAVRTSQKRRIDATIDDDFGLLKDTEAKGTRISDQINRYYETKAAELLAKMDPAVLSANHVTMDTTWDELVQMSETAEMSEEIKASYQNEQLRLLREQLNTDGDAVSYLLSNGQQVTPDNLEAANKLLKNRGETFRKIKDAVRPEKEDDILNELTRVTEEFTDSVNAQQAYEQMQERVNESLEETMYSEDMEYLDIRVLASLSKQLSLAGNLAKEENYELPAMIDGQLTSVNVLFRRTDAQTAERGNVSISVELADGEKIMTELKIRGEEISGYVGSSSREKLKQLEERNEEFVEKILSETGKKADINYVYSEEIKVTYFENSLQAGKPVRNNAKDLAQTNGQTEEAQGRHTSAKELYQAAKTFISMLED